MKFVEGERRFWKHVTYFIRRSIVASPGTTDECANRTTIIDVHCTTSLFIDQRETKKEAKRLYIQNNESQKHIPWKNMNGKFFFEYRDDMRDILFVYFFAFYEISTLKYIVSIVREKKGFAYISCCIVFEMNSCEFARTTTWDVHSTTILFVRS